MRPSGSGNFIKSLNQSAKSLSGQTFQRGLNLESSQLLHLRLTSETDAALRASASARCVCTKGCTTCCHQNVRVSAPEALAIAGFILKTWSQQQIKELLAVIDDSPYLQLSEKQEQFYRVTSPCPLLKDGACQIYSMRPIFCRTLASDELQQCLGWLVDPTTANFIKPTGTNGNIYSAVVDGTREPLPFPLNAPLDLAPALYGILKGALGTGQISLPDPRVPIPWLRIFDQRANEPSGKLDPSDAVPLQFRSLVEEESLERAIRILRPDRTTDALLKLQTPLAYRNPDEVLAWRDRFEQAISQAENLESWDAIEAFNSISQLSLFSSLYQGLSQRSVFSRIGDLFQDKVAQVVAPNLLEPLPTRKEGRIRVGFISQNLRANSGGNWVIPWIRDLDRSKFEVFALKLLYDEDPITYEAKDAADHFFTLAGNPLAGVEFVRSLDLDYLIYPDLLDTGYNLTFAMFRLARRQAVGWGVASTTGLPQIDDYLSTALMEPEGAQAEYRENLVLLPGVGVNYRIRPHAVTPRTRADFGLPSDGPLIVLAQHLNKWLPQHDLMLKQITDSTGCPLVVFDYGFPSAVRLFRERMEKLKVPIIWKPMIYRGLFQRLIELADVSLDPPDFSGGHTGYETMSVRTPIVHLPSQFMRGRQATAHLTIAGVPELIADSADQYVAIATNKELLRNARERMAPERLYEQQEPLKSLEAHIFASLGRS